MKELQAIVGCLSYIAQRTRTDILYYVNAIARYTLYPHKNVFKMCYRMLEYLGKTKNECLEIRRCEKRIPELVVYTDASFAMQPKYKSQVGFIIYFNGNPVWAKSSTAKLTAQSSTEAELFAASLAHNTSIMIKRVLEFMGEKVETIRMLSDSDSMIMLIKQEYTKMRTKFVGIRLESIKDTVNTGEMVINHVAGEMNVADILTKPALSKVFENHRRKLMGCW